MSKFITVEEFSAQTYRAPITTYRLVKAGKIPSVKMGRRILIPQAFMDDLLSKAMGE